MDDIYYLHDAGTGRLVVRKFQEASEDTIEARVELEADREGMHWGDCSWGGVSSVTINV